MSNISWHRYLCLWAMFLALAPVVVLGAMGDDDDDDDDAPQANAEAWKVRREEMKREIKEEVNEWLQNNFQKKQIVPRLAQMLYQKWQGVVPAWTILENGYEVPAPRGRSGFSSDKDALEHIREELREELLDEYHEEHPIPSREDLEKEGDEVYPMFQKGDIIPEGEINLRRGRGTNVIVHGKFTAMDPERLRIGDRWVARIDLDEKTAGRFYVRIHDKIVEEYVNDKLKLYHGKEEAWVSRNIDERLPKRFLEYWYVPKEMRTDWLYSSNPDRWMSRRAFMERAYNLNRAAVEKKKTEEFSKIKFEEARWEFYPEENDWFPQEVLEQMRAAAQAEAQMANQNNPNMPGGMGPDMPGGYGGDPNLPPPLPPVGGVAPPPPQRR